ncbi:hypothetical protein CFP56_007217 [Quercus suber]|uniref:Uncharacterized protein n=1 Tax=Quercus suber TaxID=58331 RepID=A0AAW0L8A8_QUESU
MSFPSTSTSTSGGNDMSFPSTSGGNRGSNMLRDSDDMSMFRVQEPYRNIVFVPIPAAVEFGLALEFSLTTKAVAVERSILLWIPCDCDYGLCLDMVVAGYTLVVGFGIKEPPNRTTVSPTANVPSDSSLLPKPITISKNRFGNHIIIECSILKLEEEEEGNCRYHNLKLNVTENHFNCQLAFTMKGRKSRRARARASLDNERKP